MSPPPPQIQDALREAEDADLFVECARRGWTVYAPPTSSGTVVVTPPEFGGDATEAIQAAIDEVAERNTAPEEKWLDVWRDLQRATTSHESDSLDEAAGWIIDAITGLYLLLEPPSVRQRRTDDE